MKTTIQLKNDRYRKVRGGTTRVLQITCVGTPNHPCGQLLCIYQKDGPGILRRLYLDRIIENTLVERKAGSSVFIMCPKCKRDVGLYYPYKKEDNRPAYRLFADAVKKSVVKKT